LAGLDLTMFFEGDLKIEGLKNLKILDEVKF